MERDLPIAFDTVVTVNSTGHTINSWGKDLFFLPHMITVDSENNIWMTDVALHQIFKFAPYGGDHKPLLTLGTRFQPGSDDRLGSNWHLYIYVSLDCTFFDVHCTLCAVYCTIYGIDLTY